VVGDPQLVEQPVRLLTFSVEEASLYKQVILMVEETRIARVCHRAFPLQAVFSTRSWGP